MARAARIAVIAVICGGALIVSIGIVNYIRSYFQPPPDEVIVFATLGNYPFQDSISTVWPDGSHVRQILQPEGRKSFLSVSGNSLTKPMVVTVYQGVDSKKKENHLFVYELPAGTWKRLTTQKGAEGYGAISPDNSRVVFEFGAQTEEGKKPEKSRLWLTDLRSGETRQLTTDQDAETWDSTPTWQSDSEEVLFLRFKFSERGVLSKLMSVSTSGGEPRLLAEGVVAACYSPDGKRLAMVATGGLQILDLETEQRKLIVPWEKLPNYRYLSGGLTWSRDLDKIAFGILNQNSGESELWTVSSDGTNATKIYGTKLGRISYPAFVRTAN
jgi:Tol biopolymer transport system component